MVQKGVKKFQAQFTLFSVNNLKSSFWWETALHGSFQFESCHPKVAKASKADIFRAPNLLISLTNKLRLWIYNI
jgi:hypothetical protein